MPDFEIDQKNAYRVMTKPAPEDVAKEVRRKMIASGIDAEKIKIVEQPFEVDSGP